TAARAALANRVTLITGGEFTRALAHAIDTDSLAELHRRFRDTDCFILDGLDQVVNRAAAQQELLAMVDHLVKRDAQIVITGRSAPFEMVDLSAALASRLSAGLVVPLRPPGPAARHALVMELARRQRSSLARDRAQSLADRLVRESTDQPTVPELVELVAKFSAALDESGEEAGPTVAAVATVANQLVAERETQRSVPLREISAAVAQYFGLKPSDLKSPSRRQLIVRARGVAIYLGRQLTDASLDRLGEHFGGRDHTTALHACRKTEELLAEDPALQQAVDQLTRQLRSDRGKPV
ncbi:MAG TPA: helix-turn-helix domain-containing protein, partial [Pirellulaceae bacterium]|nr:helix-turn-helix domain-containing protein [Pirellulaceae bacterium]